jgi:signal transduction histidine kinase
VIVQATSETARTAIAPMRVLLVAGDDQDLLHCRSAIELSAELQCQLSSVGSLHEAVVYLLDEPTDLALVSLPLPDAIELDAISTLAGRFPALPIVVHSHDPDSHTAVLALHAGAQEYLTGPIADPDSLARVLRHAAERKRAEQIRRDREAAESANRAKSAFLSQMSHELRTPLTAILGFAQLLELQAGEAEQELVKPIMRAGRQLQKFIEEILDIARIDAGELSLSLEPVQLSEVLDEAIELIEPLAASKGITIDADLAPVDRIYVLADRQRAAQVFLNLLSNAVKYDSDGGRTRIRCLPSPGRVRIDVTDTGPGLSQEQLAALFTPFSRMGGHPTGKGLGLVITKRLTEAMGGGIGLISAPAEGTGTTAWTEWTVVPDPTLATASATDPASVPSLTGTVLYIEDNFINVSLVQALLARHPGVRLMSVMKAHLGLELAEQHRPDVVLMDLHLPDMSGEEALAQLRIRPATRDIPVIVISADATPGPRERILARGACAFLTKPFNVDELLDALALAMAERPTGSGDESYPARR